MSIKKILITKEVLEEKIKDIRKKIDINQLMRFSKRDWILNVEEVAKELYQILIGDLGHMLEDKDLIIIPHNILHYLPFNALHDGESWFIEKYNARFLQSASMRKFLKEKKTGRDATGREALVVGDPKKNSKDSKEEATKIAHELNIAHEFNVTLLLGDEAEKEIVIKNSKDKGLLHFSCHGNVEADFPILSRLELADDNLFVTDAYNLDLNADIVVLSGCETGLGGLTKGDEVEGLTRAFMRAGTPSVIASLWAVDSTSTSELFSEYYKGNGDKVERLRDAQMKIQKMKEYEHPYFWAGFVMFGEKSIESIVVKHIKAAC